MNTMQCVLFTFQTKKDPMSVRYKRRRVSTKRGNFRNRSSWDFNSCTLYPEVRYKRVRLKRIILYIAVRSFAIKVPTLLIFNR